MRNDWIIIPYFRTSRGAWTLYRLDRLVEKQDYARNNQGEIRYFTTRSGARGVRSRLRHNGEASA